MTFWKQVCLRVVSTVLAMLILVLCGVVTIA